MSGHRHHQMPSTPQRARHQRSASVYESTTTPIKVRMINITLGPTTPTTKPSWNWAHATKVKYVDQSGIASPVKKRASTVSVIAPLGSPHVKQSRGRSNTIANECGIYVPFSSKDVSSSFDKENKSPSAASSPVKGSVSLKPSKVRHKGARSARALLRHSSPAFVHTQHRHTHASKHRRNQATVGISTELWSDNVFESPASQPNQKVLGSAFEPKKATKASHLNFTDEGFVVQPAKSVATTPLIDLVQSTSSESDESRTKVEVSPFEATNVSDNALKISGLTSTPMVRQCIPQTHKSSVLPAASPNTLAHSEVPTIIITPPLLPPAPRDLSNVPQRQLNFGLSGAEPSVSTRSSASNTAGVRAPELAIEKLRATDDHRALSRFKSVVDAFLSDFFAERSQEYVDSMILRFVDLLNSTIDPNGSCDIRGISKVQQVPSLCAFGTVYQGAVPALLSFQWVRHKLLEQLEVIIEHVVSGMIALIVDTPYSMALLAAAIQTSFEKPGDIHFGYLETVEQAELLNKRDAMFEALVDACASAVGYHGRRAKHLSPSDMVKSSASRGDDAAAREWRTCLDGIDPAARFIECMLNNITTILQRGEYLRERNNLLVAPPPRRGSRRRWQAIDAEIRAQKSWHDNLFAKLTSGEMSEQEYRSEQRRRAAYGYPRDAFVSLNLVRFIGELYKVDIVSINEIRLWLRRLLFDTVFPGVPSVFELEAGCALLITVGVKLQRIASIDGHFKGQSEGSTHTSYELMEANTSPIAPSRKAVRLSSSDDQACLSSQSTLFSCIDRLRDIEQIDEMTLEGKSWCREVVALHERQWRPMNRAEQLSTVTALAAQAARRARRAAVNRPAPRASQLP